MYRLHLNTQIQKKIWTIFNLFYIRTEVHGAKKRVILHKKWEIFVRFGLQLLITVYKVLITDQRCEKVCSMREGHDMHVHRQLNLLSSLWHV